MGGSGPLTSLANRAVPVVLRVLGRTGKYTTAESAEQSIEQAALRPRPYGPPKRIRSDVAITVERQWGWPIYTVAPETDTPPRRAVVYLHGGAWVSEIASQHWQLIAQVAAEAQVNVIVPIYPLLPFGTAAEVVPRVVELAAATASSTHDVCLAGDSAGGQIALSAALQLREDRGVAIARTLLISPVLDLLLANPLISAVQPTDPWLSREPLQVFARRWAGDLPLNDPQVSPLAAELTGLGPLTVFSGTRDILNPDARLLVERAKAAGVDMDYHEQKGLLHVYPLLPTPEGRAARAMIVERLRPNDTAG